MLNQVDKRKINSVLIPIVCFVTILIVCIHITSIIFPGLIVKLFSQNENELQYFELGANFSILIISNIIFFLFLFIYHKKKFKIVSKIFSAIQSFELSRQTTIIIIAILLSIYVGLSVDELFLNESEYWPDFDIYDETLKIWPFGKSSNPYVSEQADRHVRMFLLYSSQIIFQNVKVIPFLASISLLIVTFFLTKAITGKRIAGLVSMIIVLQSYTFLLYDTVAVYENFWVLFYILSLYTILKKWYLSPIVYILSIFSKAFTFTFLPMNLYFLYRTSLEPRKKYLTVLLYGIAVAGTLSIWLLRESIYSSVINIDMAEFMIGMTSWSYQLRFDYLIIFGILPLTASLIIKSVQGMKTADSVLFLILGSLVAGPFVVMLSDFYYMLPYRFVPLIIFFAVGCGMLLYKKSNSQ